MMRREGGECRLSTHIGSMSEAILARIELMPQRIVDNDYSFYACPRLAKKQMNEVVRTTSEQHLEYSAEVND